MKQASAVDIREYLKHPRAVPKLSLCIALLGLLQVDLIRSDAKILILLWTRMPLGAEVAI